jgi:hypothetical protein
MIPKTSAARWLAGMSAGVAAIAFISIVVVLTTNQGVTLDPNTPEGTVQRYIQALQDEQYDKAFNLLSVKAQEDCTLADFRLTGRIAMESTVRVRLDRVQEASDGTEVRLELENFSGISPLDLDFTLEDGRYTVTYLVVEMDDRWRISHAPWPYRGCPVKARLPQAPATPTPTPAQAATPAAPAKVEQ